MQYTYEVNIFIPDISFEGTITNLRWYHNRTAIGLLIISTFFYTLPA